MFFSGLFACGQNKSESIHDNNPYYSRTDTNKLSLSEARWKEILPEELFEVSRHKDTEQPFSGKYWDSELKGTYYCSACGNELFKSDSKFSSTCGWPSFFEQKSKNCIIFKEDNTFNMKRIEALCGRCGGHLGHLFDDGPAPTYKRYCMNSIALDFVPDTNLDFSNENIDTIVLGGGCYWCVEAIYEELKGIISVEAGFSGGFIANPTYKQVCSGVTQHAEVVQIVFDNKTTNLDEILKVFFSVHDPTTLNRQGADIGSQYRSVIFYSNEEQKKISEQIINQLNNENVFNSVIVTKVEPLKKFYKADITHQDYYKNYSEDSYCKLVIQPKIEKFEKVFKDRVK